MATKLDTHAILVKHYTQRLLEEWKWQAIVLDANCNVERDEFGERVGRSWLGTVLGLYPSGKIYTFWTTNQTSSDIRRDSAFQDALEAVAESYGGCIEHDDDSVFFVLPPLDQPSTPEDEMEEAAQFDINE
jgi:hypothetical protein